MNFRLIDLARSVEEWAIRKIVAELDALEALIVRLGVRLQSLEAKLNEYIEVLPTTDVTTVNDKETN